MERPAPIRSSWVTLRVGGQQNRATCEGAGHEKDKIYRSRCPCGDDRGGGGGADRGGPVAGRDSEREESIRRLVKKLGPVERLRVCYEAGPTGYVVYWQLTTLGVRCEVVAPTLVPVKAGDRVKTDRRDAEKLARSYRAGDLTAVWVPDATHEALARPGAGPGGREERSVARAASPREVPAPPRATPRGADDAVDAADYLRGSRQAVHFEQPAQEATLLDYLHEVEHAATRIERLERAIDDAIVGAPPQMRAVIEALQALRGIAKCRRSPSSPKWASSHGCARAAADGLLRHGGQRALQRRAPSPRRDHQDRQRASCVAS